MAFFNKKDPVRTRRALVIGNTYSTEDGRKVFKDLIVSAGLFSSIDDSDPQAVPRHNIAASLRYEMGILHDDNIDKIVDSLLELRYKE